MKKILLFLIAIMYIFVAKGQCDINGVYHSDWMKKVKKKNCEFRISIAFHPDTDWASPYYILYADTISNSINYTVYLFLFNDIETGEERFLTKTGTLDELIEWGKKPYKNDEFGNSLFETDQKDYVIWNRETAFGMAHKTIKQPIFGLEL